MRVTFTKELPRYAVLVERAKGTSLRGHGVAYDDALPHDLLHFLAEVGFEVE